MVPSKTLLDLPEELVHAVIERLDKTYLSTLSLVSRRCYDLVIPLIWREVHLVDCRTLHTDFVDEHDDTPLLKKMLVLAQNPKIASCVQIVEHRCYLPPPAIFNELPKTPFSGQTLSPDARTSRLIQLAVRHMSKVHTLRIIFGHPNINDALLRCFFDKNRQHSNPIRRLWLENCRISAGAFLPLDRHPLHLPLQLDFSGLESIRFRRLPMRSGTLLDTDLHWDQFVYARGISAYTGPNLQDGAGGVYTTTLNDLGRALSIITEDSQLRNSDNTYSAGTLFSAAQQFDDRIFKSLAQLTRLPAELTDERYLRKIDYVMWKLDDERQPALNDAFVACVFLNGASSTLTSLCFDWVLTRPYSHSFRLGKSTQEYSEGWNAWIKMFSNLFHLRFPNLRALQFRNAVVQETLQPPGFYLLDHARVEIKNVEHATTKLGIGYRERLDLACLEFMEAHPNLQCLAWPMENFFYGNPAKSDIIERVNVVVDNLGRTLTDLRVDTLYNGSGERQTESVRSINRECRRRFVTDFASKMTKLESIKIEGGMPRDERREVIRALHACPLKKVVIIGVCSSIGNTWGAEGRDLGETLSRAELESLEPEHKDAIFNLAFKRPVLPAANFQFEPTYGWPPAPPIIHTIAAYHAHTVTELKFCGYKGAPILFHPTAITQPMLYPLKYFDKLESLIMSMWLSTVFEDDHHDADIIKYWLDMRSPSSTSLVRTVIDEEPEGWERELRTKFAPDALAWHITSLVGPFLSESAKARAGGVHVRASMCVGEYGGIFDIDMHIGKGSLNSDVCLDYIGPREELEPNRRRSKLENRRWF